MIEIGDVKKRGPKGTTYHFTSWWYSSGV